MAYTHFLLSQFFISRCLDEFQKWKQFIILMNSCDNLNKMEKNVYMIKTLHEF